MANMIVSGTMLDEVMKANRVGREGQPFREALGRLNQELTGGDDEVSLTGLDRDVDLVFAAVQEHKKRAEGPRKLAQKPQEEDAEGKPIPARTASKMRAAARKKPAPTGEADENDAPRPTTQAEAKAARLARQKAEKQAAKPKREPKPKAEPKPKREKIFEDGVEKWVCHCGAKADASQQTYNAGWRIPRTLTTALCPEHSGAEPVVKKEKPAKEEAAEEAVAA